MAVENEGVVAAFMESDIRVLQCGLARRCCAAARPARADSWLAAAARRERGTDGFDYACLTKLS